MSTTFLAWRVGSGNTGLENKNAGNLYDLASTYAYVANGGTGDRPTDMISCYEVVTGAPFGDYIPYTNGQSETPSRTHDRVGRSSSYGGPRWYSFPRGGHWSAQHRGTIKASDLYPALSQLVPGYVRGGKIKVTQDQVAQALAKLVGVPVSESVSEGIYCTPTDTHDMLGHPWPTPEQARARAQAQVHTKTITVYRWGSGPTGLDNKNAADAKALLRIFDNLGNQDVLQSAGHGTHISAYRVVVKSDARSDEDFWGDYIHFSGGVGVPHFVQSPSSEGSLTNLVGRAEVGSGAYYYSFPKFMAKPLPGCWDRGRIANRDDVARWDVFESQPKWNAQHVKTVTLDDFKRAVLKPGGSSRLSALHSLFGISESRSSADQLIQEVLAGSAASFDEALSKLRESSTTFKVYRLGRGASGLENKNAGNLDGLLTVLDRDSDGFHLGFKAWPNKVISVYEVICDLPFSSYVGFNQGQPDGGVYGSKPIHPGHVGKEDDWFSFPKGGAWAARHIKDVPVVQLDQLALKKGAAIWSRLPEPERLAVVKQALGESKLREGIQRLTVYRLGAGSTDLRNKNAADLAGFAGLLGSVFDYESSMDLPGTSITKYEVEVDGDFGDYARMRGNSQYDTGPAHTKVGRWNTHGGLWFSFPALGENKTWKVLSTRVASNVIDRKLCFANVRRAVGKSGNDELTDNDIIQAIHKWVG